MMTVLQPGLTVTREFARRLRFEPTGTITEPYVQKAIEQVSEQSVNCIQQIIGFGDAGASAGIQFATIPQGSVITDVIFEITTAFNAGGTNPIGIGTTALGTQLVNAAGAGSDLDPKVVGVTRIGRGVGSSLAAGGATKLYYSYVPTGDAPTTGAAKVTIMYRAP